MAEEKKLSVSEVRKTMATSLAAAFGFVIALMWSNVVLNGLATAGVKLQPDKVGEWLGWAGFVVVALVLTIVMIVLIIVVSRWGSKAQS